MRYLLACLLAGCGASTPSPAASSAEQECSGAAAEFHAEHEAGVLTCEQAKAKIATDHPGCHLAIHCKDGGQ